MWPKISLASDKDWDNLLAKDSAATFFHSRDWYSLAEKHYNHKIVPRLVSFESGRRVLLPLSSHRHRGKLRKRFTSSPFGTYGSFLSDQVLAQDEINALWKLLSNFSSIVLRENPYSKLLNAYPDFTYMDFTHAISLTDPWEEIFARMNKKQIPRKVRQAEKNGLVLKRIGTEYVPSYHRIYKKCQSRWGRVTSNYSEEFFEDLMSLHGCDFWGVFNSNGDIIGGGPLLKCNYHVVSWLTLASPETFHQKPYEFAYFNLIRHYKEKGFRWFDFNPSGGHKGVAQFKENFGAEKINTGIVRK